MSTLQIVSGGRSYDLDTLACRLFREHNEVVPLSRKQWDLLHYLVRNPNRLVTKEDLITTIWKGAAVTDDAVTQTVRSLRRVFDDESKSPAFIESEYGRGYRFIAEVKELGASEAEPPSGAGIEGTTVESMDKLLTNIDRNAKKLVGGENQLNQVIVSIESRQMSSRIMLETWSHTFGLSNSTRQGRYMVQQGYEIGYGSYKGSWRLIVKQVETRTDVSDFLGYHERHAVDISRTPVIDAPPAIKQQAMAAVPYLLKQIADQLANIPEAEEKLASE